MEQALREKIERAMGAWAAAVDEDTLRRVVHIERPLHLQKGRLLFAENEAFFLLSGLIRGFYLDRDGNDVTHVFLFEGATYGADFLTTEKPHLCSFEALEPCVALGLDMPRLREAMQTDTKLLWAYIHMLEQAMKAKTLRETGFVTKTATERYLDLKTQRPDIENRVSQAHIASYLGINAASLSRIRRAIREEKKGEQEE